MSRLGVGDPVPWFVCLSAGSKAFPMSGMAGRWTVLTFFGSAAHPATRAVIGLFRQRADLFDGSFASQLLVSNDPKDASLHRVLDAPPGFLVLWDLDQKVSRQLGVIAPNPAGGRDVLTTLSYVVDPSLHVAGVFPITDPAAHVDEVCRFLAEARSRPVGPLQPGTPVSGGLAPVLLVPHVLEPELCRALIAYFEAGKPEESGLMKAVADGSANSLVVDYDRKRRRDLQIADPALLEAVHERMERRVVPELEKAFQFRTTRIERYVVACYDAETGGHFSAHRDNSGPATAHRKFACTINLNPAEYEGGDLSFPEYGPQRYRAPEGGAVVFSCALLHEAHTVTRGHRYCVIPFLYDEEGERVRQEFLAGRIDPALRRAFGAATNHKVRR